MKYFISFIIVFILIYLFYLIFVISKKDSLKKFKDNTFLRYLVKIYKLDIKKLDMKQMANIIGLTNAFIISITYSLILLVDGFIKQMLLALGIFILLDLIIYHIIGTILKRRDKNV